MRYNSSMGETRPDFDEYVEQFREELTKSWETLPEETRQKLTDALGLLPGDVQNWRSLIDEAVELAKRYSTEQSGRFVNGVLAELARRERPGETDGESTSDG